MSKKVILVWFRNDLRLHDNEVLVEAINKSDLIIPVYFFDPRYYKKNKFDLKNTGVLRASFLLDAVEKLKTSLKELGSDLMTFVGYPEQILPKLCAKYEVMEVFHHREVAYRETMISERVEEALWEIKINLRHFIGHTLFHKEDLPFPVKDIPNKFNIFRKKIERESSVRKPIPIPVKITTPSHLEKTALPTLLELGYTEEEIHKNSNTQIAAGEQEGLRKLQLLLDPEYKGYDNFSLISPYIATGALSPIYVYNRMLHSNLNRNKKRFEHLMSTLLWRDYFRFMLKKYPNVFFRLNGCKKQENIETKIDEESASNWRTATTGEEVIDTAISKLINYGHLNYCERRLVSSYFLQEISKNWLLGASFFEEHLLDYTPATNYGFWSHISGVGTSEKENKPIEWRTFAKKLAIKNVY